jgi:hypothetical protein
MNRTTTKKLFGGIMIVSLVTTIGAILGTAETDDRMIDKENPFDRFELGRSAGGYQPFYPVMSNDSMDVDMSFGHFRGDEAMNRSLPFFSELTEEQQNEIESLREDMINNGATPEEIREAVTLQLKEYGIEIQSRDDMLDDEIERTAQRLEILERQKILREEGYSWEDIKNIIAEEFENELQEGHQSGLPPDDGFHRVQGKGVFDRPSVNTSDSDI